MTTEALRNMLNAQPFHPFRVHLADSHFVDVIHPEFVGFGGGRTFIAYTNDDNFEVIDLLLVSSMETINGKPKRRGAGETRRRG
ncbi:MAG TPA: hypothetical protein VMM76_00120 [Pirellulaceae bacterium]|nr:hypothetical protein [Pirellulaceae bacterium]